ncbi:hypothetical protein Caci_3039 [Catenulispora acidiphila DSM 44928]|uniref:Uncharacterized protein n=1 Tax=Catenulispora acidiphila (strain DSM 44928 / JCM 14897 / NBRC 102108 / NRRL B-24433 / ID139908) TaxID=479433 RepID=C7Q4H9_CATAD|nr:hypothetical protein [Catenulispora acidiphila]ACU71948.1 hypothetical protein Caci_3039 [Catenulispora acidiphila DSM 44928]
MTTFFTSTTVDALNVEIDALIEQILADGRNTCPECGGLCLTPFVDVNPARIPRTDARAQDRIQLFLDRQDLASLPASKYRIDCATPAVAEHTAALLRALGAPARAIHLGGF